MHLRLRRFAFFVLLVACSLALQGAPAASHRVIAIGDIHGDYDALVGILGQAGLINSRHEWTGGRTVLVQTGDFTDRGPRVRAVMDLLISLQESAPRTGGEVRVLLGNHEALNLLALTRDVSRAAMAEFADAQSEQRRKEQYDRYVTISSINASKFGQPPELYQPPSRDAWLAEHPPGFVEYLQAFSPAGVYGRWLRSLPVAIKIDDTVFMHAGVDPARAPGKLDDINKNVRREQARFDDLRRGLIAAGWATDAFTMPETIGAAQAARLLDGDEAWNGDGVPAQKWALINPDGPLWFSGLATSAAEDLDAPLSKVLNRYHARRFVVGHSVMANGRIGRRFDGRVVLIDTGMLSSHFRGGRASALEILDGRLRAIYGDGAAGSMEP